MSILPKVPTHLLTHKPSIPSPAIIYDYDTIIGTVKQLKQDIEGIPNATLCFSVKANRNDYLLAQLASLGVGADVASVHELRAAHKAQMSPIYSTSPALILEELDEMIRHNIIFDFNSISQLTSYFEQTKSDMQAIGLRIKIPHLFEDDIVFGENSRFGIRVNEYMDWAEVSGRDVFVKQLHLHVGEMKNASSMEVIMRYIEEIIHHFPAVNTVNLGGGLTYLYSNEKEVKKTWQIVSKVMKRINRQMNREIKVVIEPGMLMLALSGYLYSTVCSSDLDGDIRSITLNSSAWNLTEWAYPEVIACYTANTDKERHNLYGNTCYENDVFIRSSINIKLEVGDAVLLTPVGAYVSSMARTLHGYPVPDEWIFKDDTFIKAGDQHGKNSEEVLSM
ncbi:hypothetical protein AB685_24140 [Bacillus sp. LL01]|uniref:hypothetical protein n=1 Tax=Bacillus sp. LL01 TaxID=1665556 RepID=UPI00064D5E60|nr:hypothetical protein [Bacillus sp. LL01]KMJ56023.1 hypothetical protein AB685_24140 [Bacillus sp. LL01]